MTTPLAGAVIAQLEADGVGTVVGTVVNPAGLTHAKTVPIRRTAAFADPGLGASPVWHGFGIDRAGIAFTEGISVVGDERVRIDLDALRTLDDGLAWAPGSFFDQDGNPIPSCARGTLARIESRLSQAGLRALVGHEIEFLLVDPEGNRLPGNLWAQYGLAGVLEHEGFVRDVTEAATAAGVGIEQFHPEYGINQFEISLTPRSPIVAADQLILARIIISRVARKYGVRVSLSPVPFAGSVGSGAHQHFSLQRGDSPVFAGGTGAQGMTPEGERAIGGIVSGLPEAQLIFCGSIVSGLRMKPGNWAGAYACWGTENREAAVRFLHGRPGNPYGANVEVKIVDPSANPYFATAAILGLALDGIENGAPLPPETPVDPATLSGADREAAGTVLLSTDQAEEIAALDTSARLRAILGDPAVDVLVAVRRYEHETYSHLDPEQLTEKFRMAWSL
ncbi:glutamine synthetase family protein [Mycobacterium sp. CVI_P3]|uniref:Glutamine synthetase family protein n=2 Tax=Mycobacterium pinniadriaticum TaxID=2994102 RepID=A0ABT3S941_9MYCO|nr:glutamine synthetase family protein [Mycobacterium pinniadriaticum]MCX2929608.1 glutamine synthetase family protein [Mycobacterium pinniadriaticum]MCX2936032.1 glutamine synthetase family protein [Mycobacterium pinniadriaticum]